MGRKKACVSLCGFAFLFKTDVNMNGVFSAGYINGINAFRVGEGVGMNMTKLYKRLNISVSTINGSVSRGENVVNDNSVSLLKLLNR